MLRCLLLSGLVGLCQAARERNYVAQSSSYTVQTTTGEVQGRPAFFPHEDYVNMFLGIPFGQPPVGPLRFAPPLAIPAWSGTYQATEWAPDCMPTNKGMSNSPAGQAEDCLYLNVYQPAGCSPGDNLPVMVYFYGGGWNMGSASFPVYNGANVIADGGQDEVIVTVNYRLGPLGFLASDLLRPLSPNNSTGNMGLLDQRLATAWVRANAEAFCGNPKALTIWGESAGSGSCANHLVMPGSVGMMDRAIMESGPYATWIADSLENAEAQFNFISQQVNCQPNQTPDVIACLQAVNVDTLVSTDPRAPNAPRFTAYAPTVDGVELPDFPWVLAQQGKMQPIPILLGSNLNEGTLLIGAAGGNLPINNSLTPSEYVEFVDSYFGPSLAPTVLSLYPSSSYDSPWWAVVQIITDQAMACPAQRTAEWAALAGGSAYLYEFTHEIDWAVFDPYLGVFHGDDLAFTWVLRWWYFDYSLPPVPIPLLYGEYDLGDYCAQYWHNFAVSGNPNAQGTTQALPFWPPANATAQPRMILDIDLSTQPSWRQPYCDFWNTNWNWSAPRHKSANPT